MSAPIFNATSYPTRSASPPPRRIGSSATNAPASRATAAVRSSEPSETTTGTTRYPSTTSGIARMTAATFSASLKAGDTVTSRGPSGSAATRSQSNRSWPSASTSSRIARSLTSAIDCTRSTRANSTITDTMRTKIRRRSLPGPKLKVVKIGLKTCGAIASATIRIDRTQEMMRFSRLIWRLR